MDRRMRLALGIVVIAILGAAVTALAVVYTPGFWIPDPDVALAPPPPADPSALIVTNEITFKRGDHLAGLLLRAGIDHSTHLEMVKSVREAFDVRKFRAGAQLKLARSLSGDFKSLEYQIDPDNKLQLLPVAGAFESAIVEIPGVVSAVPVCSSLHGSLFESIERVGEQAELAIRMAEIFAWDLDFYRDPRKGDEFCLLVEKKIYDNGQPPTYQRILAATYNNEGTLFEGYLFQDGTAKPGYYSSDGESLQSAFLRSPLKFEARVSSHFSLRRLHPVLKTYRAHPGTDYAAPTGTSVYSIGDGRVTFSARSGGSGNLIKVRHANGFETQYLHLSRRLVRNGQRVSQGQRIGQVGATGLATGPHLDFRVKKNGKYMNFERFRPPRVSRISAKNIEAFDSLRGELFASMQPGASPDAPVLAAGPSPEIPTTIDD